jgi:hypothetical protein
LFRGDKGWGSNEQAGPSERFSRLDPSVLRNGESIVPHPHTSLRGEEAIGRLHIPMKDAAGIGCLQPLENIENGIDRFLQRQGAAAADFVGEGPSAGQLHRNHRESIDFLRAENVDAAGVFNGRGKFALAQESLGLLLIFERIFEDLEGDTPFGREMFGFEYESHAAFPEFVLEQVVAQPVG